MMLSVKRKFMGFCLSFVTTKLLIDVESYRWFKETNEFNNQTI
jgi:hypothetical protein